MLPLLFHLFGICPKIEPINVETCVAFTLNCQNSNLSSFTALHIPFSLLPLKPFAGDTRSQSHVFLGYGQRSTWFNQNPSGLMTRILPLHTDEHWRTHSCHCECTHLNWHHIWYALGFQSEHSYSACHMGLLRLWHFKRFTTSVWLSSNNQLVTMDNTSRTYF